MPVIKKNEKFETPDELKQSFKESIISILNRHDVYISDDKIDFYINDVLAISPSQMKAVKSKYTIMEIYITKVAGILSTDEDVLVKSILKGLDYKYNNINEE